MHPRHGYGWYGREPASWPRRGAGRGGCRAGRVGRRAGRRGGCWGGGGRGRGRGRRRLLDEQRYYRVRRLRLARGRDLVPYGADRDVLAHRAVGVGDAGRLGEPVALELLDGGGERDAGQRRHRDVATGDVQDDRLARGVLRAGGRAHVVDLARRQARVKGLLLDVGEAEAMQLLLGVGGLVVLDVGEQDLAGALGHVEGDGAALSDARTAGWVGADDVAGRHGGVGLLLHAWVQPGRLDLGDGRALGLADQV